MALRDLLALVINNLRRMKARVAMTATGVIIGTSAVVVLMSLGAGLQKQASESLYSLASLDELTVYNNRYRVSEAEDATQQQADRPVLNRETLDNIQQMEGVIAVMPLMMVNMQGPLKLDKQEGWAQAYGIDMDAFKIIAKLDQGTLDTYRGQIIAGASVGESFIPWEVREQSETPPPPPDLLNQTLQMTSYQFNEGDMMPTEIVVGRLEVVGVLKSMGYMYNYSIFMPLKEAQRLNQRMSNGQTQPNLDKEGYEQIIVKVEDPNQATVVEQALTEQGFSVQSARQELEGINQFFLIVQAILGGIGAIALLVAAFGIANTMVMAIYERTQEIGLMKALGATNQDVMSVFLAEAGSIGLLGGLGGVLLSVGLNTIINIVGRSLLPQDGGLFGGPGQEGAISLTAMPLWLPIFAIFFATMIGIASGIYPAIRAAALSPIRALKYE
ncbi:MAG: ABC transporter permease [Anaerolineae bacterium]|nr:ABC transporter permease [Anaerolineae bacterium]